MGFSKRDQRQNKSHFWQITYNTKGEKRERENKKKKQQTVTINEAKTQKPDQSKQMGVIEVETDLTAVK